MLFSVLLISLLLGTQLSTVISFFWSKEQKQQEHAQELFSSSLDSDYSLLIYPSGEHENGVLTTLSREDCVKPLEKTLCHAFIAAKNNLSMREGISKEERIEKEEEEDVVIQRREEEEQIAQICEGCSLFNEFGVQMKSCSDLMLSPSLPSQQSQRVFLVQRNRLFVFPTIDIGHRVTLSHVKTAGTGEEAKAVELVTLSHSPRVFQLHNFFTHAEADALILSALTISEEAYRLKRSTTGNGESIRVDPSRTSDTCFDPFSETAMTLKQRSFELLGIRPFHNDWADGLQLLRYNVSGGYNSHMGTLSLDGNTPLFSTSNVKQSWYRLH